MEMRKRERKGRGRAEGVLAVHLICMLHVVYVQCHV